MNFAKQNKEADISTNSSQRLIEPKKNNKGLMFISANVLKYKEYKKLLKQQGTIKGRVSICNNKQSTIIYLGPLETQNIQQSILSNVRNYYDNTAKKVILTQKEFDDRCGF